MSLFLFIIKGYQVNQLHQPSIAKVSLTLCLVSFLCGVILYLAEYIVDTEMSGSGMLSTIMPAMLTGMYFGSKQGQYLPSKTRWGALAIWIAASFIYAAAVFYYYDFSFADLSAMINELGWFSLIILVVSVLVFLASYAAFKFGEKAGIKTYLQKKAKIESANTTL